MGRDLNTIFNGKKLTLTAVGLLGVGHKPYVYTCRRTRFLDEFGKIMSLMVELGRAYLPSYNILGMKNLLTLF